MMETTLRKIRTHGFEPTSLQKLLQALGKTMVDDEPLPITTILDSNGLDDALWCLRAVKGHKRKIRLLAVRYARKVEHLMTDPRDRHTLDVAERYANGEATDAELAAAGAASWKAWNKRSVPGSRPAARAVSGDPHITAAAARWDAATAAAFAAKIPGDNWDASEAAFSATQIAYMEDQEAELRRFCAAVEAKQRKCGDGVRDDLDLIRSVLDGYPASIARDHALSVVRKLIAAKEPQ